MTNLSPADTRLPLERFPELRLALGSVSSVFFAGVSAFLQWRKARAEKRILESLDDHLRQDIGLPPRGPISPVLNFNDWS